jgi:hypothetical protein
VPGIRGRFVDLNTRLYQQHGQDVWLAGSAPNLKLWEEEREGREAVRHRRVFV